MIDFIINHVTSAIKLVHVMTGGNQWLATAIFAGLAIALRKMPHDIYSAITRQLIVTIKVIDESVERRSGTIDIILLYLRKHSSTRFQRTFIINENAKTLDRSLMSGFGSHLIKVDGVMLLVTLSANRFDAGETRSLSLKTWFWNLGKLQKILGEINPQHYGLPSIYDNDEGWLYRAVTINEFFGKQQQLIDKELYDEIDNIFNRFCNDDEYYTRQKRLRKETFFLHGPPGTGKTTLFRHLASKYGISIVLLTPATLRIGLRNIVFQELGKVLILMEDISLTNPHPNNDEEPNENLLQVLLNELSGVKPLNDVIIAMTTNHIEEIPSEVYRPGRVDHLIEFGYPSKQTVMKTISFDHSDPRYQFLDQLEVSDIPLDNIVSICNAKDLNGVKKIIEARDNYLKLSLHSK